MSDRPIILDGGTGRELQRRGLVPSRSIWSGWALLEHPDVVRDVHEAFIGAGADVITTSNYGVVPTLLEKEDMSERLEELVRLSVRLALEARDNSGETVHIAGSLPPLTGSYRPDLVDVDEVLAAGYGELAAILAPDVDLFICETMSSAREALAAASAAAATGKPVWVAWTLGEAADGCLRSGETVATAYAALADLDIAAYLFNCCAPEAITAAIPGLRALTDRRIGGYANAFQPVPTDYVMGRNSGDGGETPLRHDLDPDAYASVASRWRTDGADIIGGCCGIGPEHIAVLRDRLDA